MSDYQEHQDFCENATEKYVVDLSNEECRQLIRDHGLTMTVNDTCPGCLALYRDNEASDLSLAGGE